MNDKHEMCEECGCEFDNDDDTPDNRVDKPNGKRFRLHRTLCDVLWELRTCHESRNYGNLLGLVEEAQTMANRMETALSYKRDIREWELEARELGKKIDAMQEEAYRVGLVLDKMQPENTDI